ncbi:hypothetical protein Forpe1208_v016043 [Fusarium oxysporum f. sp. rapae]|uniref:Uncharacterized protein n=1 Tax=Fusarium oxysporum f. sp. rapae TaxID=485398 RepID=A0A8J5NGQ9_FUSOX|nr:hypothetical protein Forpe1208_v016043 [Fusarium oxysporum f. sp. rapae]
MSVANVPRWLQGLPKYERLIKSSKLLIYIRDSWLIDEAQHEISQIKKTGCILAQWESNPSSNFMARSPLVDAWVEHTQIITMPGRRTTIIEKQGSNGSEQALNAVEVLQTMFETDIVLIIGTQASIIEMPNMTDNGVFFITAGGSVKSRIEDLFQQRSVFED